jgi:hypothetical protein
LEEGSYFGESALSVNSTNKRSATIRAETVVECLSIAKSAFFNVFGDDVSHLVEKNMLRTLIRSNYLLKDLSIFHIERFINHMQRQVFDPNDTIFKKGDTFSSVFFLIGKAKFFDESGDFSQTFTMKSFGIDKIESSHRLNEENTLVAESSYCVIYTLRYEDIAKCLEGLTIDQACKKNLEIRELYSRVNTCKKISSLNGLKFVKNIGVGGYGTVMLTID